MGIGWQIRSSALVRYRKILDFFCIYREESGVQTIVTLSLVYVAIGWHSKDAVFDSISRLVDKGLITQKGFCREH